MDRTARAYNPHISALGLVLILHMDAMLTWFWKPALLSSGFWMVSSAFAWMTMTGRDFQPCCEGKGMTYTYILDVDEVHSLKEQV